MDNVKHASRHWQCIYAGPLTPFDYAETVLGLLRNPKYCVYGASQMFNERTLDRGEDTFNRISMEERGKYKEETLVNYGGRQRSAPSR